jgi:hypothetical protein
MGTAEGQVRTEQGRITDPGNYFSKASEPGSAKEVIGNREGPLGCEEEGRVYISLEAEVCPLARRLCKRMRGGPELSSLGLLVRLLPILSEHARQLH